MSELLQKIRQLNQYPDLLPISQNYPHIGCHMSISDSFAGLIRQMNQQNATACAFFTSNVRGWSASLPDPKQANNFIMTCKDKQIGRNQFLPHAPYLINLCSDTEETRKKSYERLFIDTCIVRQLGLDRLNFHPGSTSNKQTGLKTIANVINEIHQTIPDVILVLETMTGSKKNTTVGCNFKELKQIIDLVTDKSRVGVCIDTQHTYAGAFVSRQDFAQKLLQEFDFTIGAQYLKGFHINDSKTEYGSNVDRHESVGKGYVPVDQISQILQAKRLVPHCLETPDETLYKTEIQQLKEFSEIK